MMRTTPMAYRQCGGYAGGFRSAGLSIIELMVALTIGAFLVLGVTTVFLANKDSATLENSLARLQENGRFALDLMREDLHRSQYLGCNTGDVFVINMIEDPNTPGFTQTLEGVRGYERQGDGAWAALPPVATDLAWSTVTAAETAGGARNGSDVLTVRMTERLNADDPNDPLLTTVFLPGNTDVSIDDNPDCTLQQNSWAVLTGCALTAHLFQVSNAQTCTAATPPNPTTLEFDSSVNFNSTINTTYDLQSEVLAFEEVAWFVADTGRDRNGFDVWALFRDVRGDGLAPQEMIEGVEFMQIKFGQRVRLTDPTQIRYVDPSDAELNAADNYEGLISVRVALLMQGFDRVRNSPDDRTYVLIDEQVVPPAAGAVGQGGLHGAGAVQREVFTTTVNLRNAPDF